MSRSWDELRVQTLCLLVLTAIALGVALNLLQAAFVPFVMASFLMYAIAPVIDFARGTLRLPVWLAVVGTMLLLVAAIAALGAVTAEGIRELAANPTVYVARLDTLRRELVDALPLRALGFHPDRVDASLVAGAQRAGMEFLGGAVNLLSAAVSDAFVVILIMAFLVAGRYGARTGGAPTAPLIDAIEQQVRAYASMKLAISLGTGAAQGLVLAFFGVPFAVLFGALAVVLNFVPNFGPLIASALPLPLIVLHPELSAAAMVACIALVVVVQTVSGNVVEPRLMGDALHLHPVVVVITLLLFGAIWGLTGMFLATPLTAVLRILFEKLDHTRPLALLMAGQVSDAFAALEGVPAASLVPSAGERPSVSFDAMSVGPLPTPPRSTAGGSDGEEPRA